jgi:hypothetical protein
MLSFGVGCAKRSGNHDFYSGREESIVVEWCEHCHAIREFSLLKGPPVILNKGNCEDLAGCKWTQVTAKELLDQGIDVRKLRETNGVRLLR